MTIHKLPSSFRDPSGFLYTENDTVYRQVNECYRDSYDLLKSSGLYDSLVDGSMLIPHDEVNDRLNGSEHTYKVLHPQQLDFISYPYEWCFSQYKDAALLTLGIQKRAMDHGMCLKDASAYNVQFVKGKPIFIDTLSFEPYNEGDPWVAYGQFCRHFLAPLALMSLRDIRLGALMKTYIDGIPLDLVSSLLPFSSKLKFSILSHIHLHAKAEKKYEKSEGQNKKARMSKYGLTGIIDNLISGIEGLKWTPGGTEWAEYYDETNYSDSALNSKRELVSSYVNQLGKIQRAWDLGANTGEFSRVVSKLGIDIVSFDIDPAAVEKNYLQVCKDNEQNILPLLNDLTNPSPDIGWANQERASLNARGPVDLVLALALVHHLAISNNVPLYDIANYFSRLCTHLIIEFVPKDDSKVQFLLETRNDIFDRYTQSDFEKEFSEFFEITAKSPVAESTRIIYLMRSKPRD